MQKEDCWALTNAILVKEVDELVTVLFICKDNRDLHLLRKILRGQKTEGGLKLILDSLRPFNTGS